ncbi:MAG: hypothetical protein GWP15_00640 [Nitrospirae bacterium]|nr:hypothetical protein [Nitrospirota bacterium]
MATKENEKELAEKVVHMSKPALQEYSKEKRGKVTTGWQVELDEKMMFMFLKLKKKLGKNLSNKECLRKILEHAQSEAKCACPKAVPSKAELHKMQEKPKPQRQAQKTTKIPTATAGSSTGEKPASTEPAKVNRYISVQQKRNLSEQCSHQNCHRPAEVIHHPNRFSQNPNHENLKPLCKQHHEFAHNGITEPMQYADYQYRKHRQAALL